MSYKYINSRQILNSLALPNTGAPANDNLADILNKIDAALAASSSGSGYVAKKVVLTSGSTSQVVTLPVQPDTSYIVLAMMGNTTDAFPQYQQVQVTAKATTGFTFSWNHALDSSNYFLYYIIPYKVFPEAEAAIGSGQNTLSATLPIVQPFNGYGAIAQIQNLIDTNPQFQTTVIGANSTAAITLEWNVNTDTASYQEVYMVQATAQMAIPSGVTSVTVPVPVAYGTTNYAVIATMQNADAHPQFQPVIVTAQASGSVTFGFNVATDTADYKLNIYAISLTT